MTKNSEQPPTIRRISWVIWGVLAGLIIVLTSAYSRAWKMNEVLQAEVATLAPMLTAVLEEQAALQAQLDYVQSDAYVDEWSRVNARMTKPGETLVVPIIVTPTPSPTIPPAPSPTPTPTPLPFWQQWWRALTGD
jgi:cell division protein FtsB